MIRGGEVLQNQNNKVSENLNLEFEINTRQKSIRYFVQIRLWRVCDGFIGEFDNVITTLHCFIEK